MTPAAGLLALCCAAAAAALLVRPHPDIHSPAEPPGPVPSGTLPEWLLPFIAGVGAGVGVLVLLGAPVGLLIGPVAGAGVWHVVRRMEPPQVRRRRERLEAGLPHAVDLLAACLSVGQEPGHALEQVAGVLDGPLAEELGSVAFRLRLGVDPTTVWRSVSTHAQLGPLGRCVVRAVDSGASVAEAMHRLAEDLRRESRARVESRARAVGVKAAVPLGVCMLPAFVLVGVVPLVASSMTTLLGR